MLRKQVTIFLQLNIIYKTSHVAALSQVTKSRAAAWSSCVCVPCALCSLFPAAVGWSCFVKPLTSVLSLLQFKKGLAHWAVTPWLPGNLPHNSTKTLTRFLESDVSASQRKTLCIVRHLAFASWQNFSWKCGRIASKNNASLIGMIFSSFLAIQWQTILTHQCACFPSGDRFDILRSLIFNLAPQNHNLSNV